MIWRLMVSGWLVLGAGVAQAAGPLDQVVADYYQAQWAAHPIGATGLGLHEGDERMDDVSAAAYTAGIELDHAALKKLEAIDAGTLSGAERDDRAILIAEIGGSLLADEQVQSWRHNPDIYVGVATNAVYGLIARDFAPLSVRMRAATARQNAMPKFLADARRNLVDMPRIYIDIALENAAGADSFLSSDAPQAFAAVEDKALKARYASSTTVARKAVAGFVAFLKARQGKAKADFAYGEAHFRGLLAADMIDLTPAQVLAAGEAQLKRDRAAFDAAAKLIDPAHPERALDEVAADHPDSAHLVSTAAGQLGSLRDFVRTHHIITLPSDGLPRVGETPPFQRAVVFGEMDPPGVFEIQATTAYYYITPANAADTAAKQDMYLSYFNRPLLLNLTVHEAMPGHFVQFLYAQAHPDWSLVRKMATSYTATEGWAHYTEQMMADEGLDANDPKRRITQVQDALLRDCRLIVSVKMHTQGMSLPDAAKLMKDECLQPEGVAYKEARRGTSDPGYFSYTLGKLMIQKLRADRQAKLGSGFSLQAFHDAFLSAGLVPLAIIRREIMGADGKLI